MKAIPGYEGYYAIEPNGAIYSYNVGRYIAARRHPRGYYHVALYKHGRDKNLLVHRLVALTYLPKVEGKEEVNHINGIKTDNRVENLEWCNRSENIFHGYANGLQVRNGGRKKSLTDQQVKAIREMHRAKVTQTHIAKDFGVSISLINGIVNNKLYAS